MSLVGKRVIYKDGRNELGTIITEEPGKYLVKFDKRWTSALHNCSGLYKEEVYYWFNSLENDSYLSILSDYKINDYVRVMKTNLEGRVHTINVGRIEIISNGELSSYEEEELELIGRGVIL